MEPLNLRPSYSSASFAGKFQKRILSALWLAILLLTGCNKDDSSNIIYIEYGTSFGNCVGYCRKICDITIDGVDYTKSGATVETRKCFQPIVYTDFEVLIGMVDLKAFTHLDDRIGCPDCADGGAEWIRIGTPSSVKEVIYEYGKEPDAVKPYIGILRDYLKSIENCK